MNFTQIQKRKIALYNAILSLENLIKSGNVKESDYQHCLENNPIIFESLGYLEFYPFTKEVQKKLPRDEYTNLQPEPDFIVKNSKGIYEIFELKTPIDKKLTISSNEYRKRFTAEISSYISQTITYNEYFTENPKNRETVEQLFDIKIQKYIPQTIVVGLEKNIDVYELHHLSSRYKDSINIITYTKILDELEREYLKIQGGEEGIKGYSINLIIKCNEKQNNLRNYIFDMAENEKKNRLSIYFTNKKELCYEILSNEGKRYEIKLDKTQVDVINNVTYITFELGIFDDMFFLSVYINGIELEKRYIFLPLSFNLNNADGVIASDSIYKKYGCKFHLLRFSLNNHTMTFRERTYLYHLMQPYGGFLNFDGIGYVIQQAIPAPENNTNSNPLPLCLYGIGQSEGTEKYMKFLNDFVYPLK